MSTLKTARYHRMTNLQLSAALSSARRNSTSDQKRELLRQSANEMVEKRPGIAARKIAIARLFWAEESTS